MAPGSESNKRRDPRMVVLALSAGAVAVPLVTRGEAFAQQAGSQPVPGGVELSTLQDELIIRYDRATGTMEIAGHVANNDVALNILQQAARVFDMRIRMDAASRIHEQRIDALRTQQILDSVKMGRA